ncbi:hypothetical protein BDF22DRAFT_383172 [Syncephalis plumigaleata]|nr:hypothetical protein BDF22DRAFT_383172 [Syncephalis plumigaleata]
MRYRIWCIDSCVLALHEYPCSKGPFTWTNTHWFPRYIFVLAVLYSIALATQLSSLASFMQEDAAYCAMQYFSILLPLLLFVYWLNKVRVLLHRMVYIVLMSLVALNMCVILVVLVASVTLLYTVKYTIDMDAGYYYWKGIMYICILSCGSALSLSVFILGRKSYMSKDDRYAQFSFLGAAVIAVFIFLAVLFSSVTGITRVFVNSFTTDDSIQYIYMIYNIRCVVMASIAIISVFVLGVDWPRKVHTRTRGKTILYDMNADNPQAISPLHMPHNMRMSGPRPVLVNMALPNAAHFANANDAAMPGVLYTPTSTPAVQRMIIKQ